MPGPTVIGVILAGGLARRMGGGDKGLATVGGITILDRVAATMRRQCHCVVINANGDASRFAALDLPIVADGIAGHPGPLAGVLAGLDWVAAHDPVARHAVTVPSDTPFLPPDLVGRLAERQVESRAPIVCAGSGGIAHGTAALWDIALREDLRRALVEENLRKVNLFADRHGRVVVSWPVSPHDPFFNANTPEDLAAAERIAAAMQPDAPDA